MPKYLVTYQETYSRTVIVEAETEDEARTKVEAAFNSELELTAENYLEDSACIDLIEPACGDDEHFFDNLDKLLRAER